MTTTLKRFARDVLEAALISAPILFAAINTNATKKSLTAAAISFGAAIVAALRRKYFPTAGS